ncbi:hypothetical protein QK414_29225 [Pseudomonas aeruginosa]|nr:hypothetical protein [Pseudomonas aeruginosa]MDI4056905.1 hypothetical protein [Pseudomonas aeruginosa]MDI4167044.1 hypothetical protein [Pseudomonas aeruginosa]
MSKHTEHSSYREKLVEHLFVSELLKESWRLDRCDLEVAKPEVDNAGYDLILEAHGVIRHVQLKASFIGSSTSKQNLHVRLGNKPSGCVVWIYFDEQTLALGPFLYFGGEPGKPLPSLEAAKVAKHTKANKAGQKGERPNIREIRRGEFSSFSTLDGIYAALFGATPAVCVTGA